MELTTLGNSENIESTESNSSSIESFDRILKLPTVETAWKQMKNSSSLFNLAISSAESAINRSTTASTGFSQKLNKPIQLVDRAVVKGIDNLEATAPIIKETPQQIYEHTKSCIKQFLKMSSDKKGDDGTATENEEEKSIKNEKM